jgi:dTDP-4-dehydrorhamnose reductase
LKVAVIGANGQLGADIVLECERTGSEVLPLTHSDADISSLDDTRRLLTSSEPSVIVTTAAMHHVENCEKDPGRAYQINALGARNLAMVANEIDAKLIYVSTDYVFSGAKMSPYYEEDPTGPLNVYGNTKLAGEAFVRGIARKWFILRTSALYGRHPCRAKGGNNFVQLMLKLAGEGREIRVVNDEIVSPTYTPFLASQIVCLSNTEKFGLYHATAEGSCTWYEFASAIFGLTNTKANLSIASPTEFPAKVPRPKYSVLENSALKRLGVNLFPTWRMGLEQYLAVMTRCN